MALQTRIAAEADAGKCRVEVDYDDVTFLAQTLRVVNTSPSAMQVTASKQSGQSVSHRFRAGFSDSFDVTAFALTVPHGTSPDPDHPVPPPASLVLIALQWPVA